MTTDTARVWTLNPMNMPLTVSLRARRDNSSNVGGVTAGHVGHNSSTNNNNNINTTLFQVTDTNIQILHGKVYTIVSKMSIKLKNRK